MLLEFVVEELENTFPMVPPGASLQETVDSPYKAPAGNGAGGSPSKTPAAAGGAR
jgi:hypothetical protein